MKESFTKISAWVKSHPWPAAGIALVIVIVGYFIVKKSGGNSEGESAVATQDTSGLDSGGAGLSAGDLSGLGSSAAASPSVLPSATPSSSVMDSFPSITGNGDAGEFSSSMYSGESSGYGMGGGLISSPIPDVIASDNPVPSVILPSNVGVAGKIMASPAQVVQKAISSISSPVKLPSNVGVAGKIIKSPAAQVVKTPVSSLKAVASVQAVKSPVLSLNRYTGVRSGYTWNGKQYIKNIGVMAGKIGGR